jgi:hypothetical protein
MSQNEKFHSQILSVKHAWVWAAFAFFFSVIVAHSAMAEPLDDNGYTRGEVETDDRAPSSIAPAVMALTQPSKIFYGHDGEEISPDLIATYNAIKSQEKPLNLCDYVPTDMTATSSSGQVFSRVADKTASTIFSSDAFRAMPIGSAATEVEKSMKADVVLGGDEPEEIQHKFNFNLQAFQALAKVQYTGITNAAVMYYALQSKLSVEVSEKIFGTKDLVFNQDFSHADSLSRVSFRWGF